MKKAVRAISLLMLTLSLALALTGCAKEEGKYVYKGDDYSVTVELKGGKYTGEVVSGEHKTPLKGTYKIKGEKIIITQDSEESVEGKIKPGKSITIDMGARDGEITLKYKK